MPTYRKLNNEQSGFTIVELMISISVLSMILLLTTFGILQISKAYYRGIIQSSTQQTARTLLANVSQNVQFGSFSGVVTGAPIDKSGAYGSGYILRSICLGEQQYSYVLKYEQNAYNPTLTVPAKQSKHALWQSAASGGCVPYDVGTADPSGAVNGTELLGENMRITKFAVTGVPNDSSLHKVSVTVMYGNDAVIDQSDSDPNKWTCRPLATMFSAAFCAKSELTTIVGKRLR